MWESCDHARRQRATRFSYGSPASPATSKLRPTLIPTSQAARPAPPASVQQNSQSLNFYYQLHGIHPFRGSSPVCVCACVCMCVFVHVCVRARAQPNLEGYEIHEVPLVKKDGQSLGISIIGQNPLSSQGETGSDIIDFHFLILDFVVIVVISLLSLSHLSPFHPRPPGPFRRRGCVCQTRGSRQRCGSERKHPHPGSPDSCKTPPT